jgi:hypothetical protein
MLSSYLVTCLTEGIKVVSDYRTTPPTTCPSNTDHTIDPIQTKIYNTISTKTVTITDNINGVGGFYKCIPYDIDIAGSTGMQTFPFYSPPYPVQIQLTSLWIKTENIGDYVEFEEYPNTTVGVLTQNALTGDTEFYVPPVALTYIFVGFKVFIGTYYVGECIDIDTITYKITTTIQLSVDMPIYSPVKITKTRIGKLELCSSDIIKIGERFNASLIAPPNTPCSINYYNQNGLPKTFNFHFEVYY